MTNKDQKQPTEKDTKISEETNPDQSQGNTIKNPDDWTTGDEPMTGAQRSYLHTLASEAKEEVDDNLSKAQASKKIDELQQETGRGTGNQ